MLAKVDPNWPDPGQFGQTSAEFEQIWKYRPSLSDIDATSKPSLTKLGPNPTKSAEPGNGRTMEREGTLGQKLNSRSTEGAGDAQH